MKKSCGQIVAVLSLTTLFSVVGFTQNVHAGDEHWSPQFPKPRSSTKMLPNTGMSDGTGKPIARRAKWHDGKLYICGAWETGASAVNQSKSRRNEYWHLWAWSPEGGWEALSYFHTGQGGSGPDGIINDFLWLPDGRMVVCGEFTRLDNPGGVMYHRVNALAVYNPKEPSANKWKPLGTFQYNGTVSAGGSLKCLAYDKKNNDLYMGGSFPGIPGARFRRKEILSPGVHKYDFDTKSYEPMYPGIWGAKPIVYKIQVDSSTTPATVYVGGSFHWTGGNGENPMLSTSTSRYTTGFASFQEGKGWNWYPKKGIRKQDGGKEAVLQRAADYKFFDSVRVLDFLVDGKDIWVVGAFSEGKGSGEKIRGIAKWDDAKQKWIDPTGKGGIGRECYSIAKGANGKLYFAGSFGGWVKGKQYYKGFNNGDAAHLVCSYDPKTKKWEQLGTGLGSRSMPEARLTVNGNDVYVVGDFNYIGGMRQGKDRRNDKKWESWYIARWNETIDFTKTPAKVPNAATKRSTHWTPPTKSWSSNNSHWSRAYPKPPRARGKKSMQSGKTGMDDGTGAPQISGIVKYKDTIYICGRWEAVRGQNWYVWTHNLKTGWQRVAWGENGAKTGVGSPPKGMKIRDDKLWVYGAISNYKGIGIYDLKTKKWEQLTGKTVDGKPVVGVSADPKRSGPVNDIAWDDKTGDLWMVGTNGYHTNSAYKSPLAVGQIIRRDKNGVYHPMGRMLKPENPGKPIVVFDSIYIDQTKTPADVYVGGTFNYYTEVSTNKAMAYNIVKFDHKTKEWAPVGQGNTLLLKAIDKPSYPKGLPGLPALPELFQGFIAAGFPRIRCLTMDKEGNLYAGGTLAVVDATVPVHKRKTIETFGIARLNAKTNVWESCTKVGGFSRDVFQFSWLDDTHLLVTGGFHYDNDWNPVHGAVVLDVKSGETTPFGGGLLRRSRAQVISSDIVHFVDGDDIYFAGLFDHVGINANSMVKAPIESHYVAHWNAKKNFDPNQALEIGKVPSIPRPKGFSSKSVKVVLTAKVTDGKGTLTWYEKRRDGNYQKKGSGNKFNANVRVRGDSPDPVYYVTVTRDGIEGGKVPIRIPLK